jgi:hypothetical protein
VVTNTSIETLLVNDRIPILDRWKQELIHPNFSIYCARTPLETLSKITRKHYDLILIDLGESSLERRPYAIAHMIRDAKPNAVLIGISGCPIIEEQSEPFDRILIDSSNLHDRLREILQQNGFGKV